MVIFLKKKRLVDETVNQSINNAAQLIATTQGDLVSGCCRFHTTVIKVESISSVANMEAHWEFKCWGL